MTKYQKQNNHQLPKQNNHQKTEQSPTSKTEQSPTSKKQNIAIEAKSFHKKIIFLMTLIIAYFIFIYIKVISPNIAHTREHILHLFDKKHKKIAAFFVISVLACVEYTLYTEETNTKKTTITKQHIRKLRVARNAGIMALIITMMENSHLGRVFAPFFVVFVTIYYIHDWTYVP